MITTDDILNLNYYKKEKFTGSYQGMRYLIRKETRDGSDILCVCIWPGPYNYETTEDSLKTCAAFPFTPEGKQLAVDWLNEQWLAGKETYTG